MCNAAGMARAGSLASRHAVRRAALRVMGPDAITHDALVERLLAEGLDLGPEPDDRVHDALHGDAGFFELDDDRWIHLPTALDGLAWATVVPDELPAPDCLPTHPDLALVEWCALDAPMPLQGASDTVHAAELDDGTDVLVGPPGWLDTRLGTTVAVRVVGGALALDPLDAVPEPHPAHVAALADAFGRTAHTDVLRSEFLPGDEVEITLGDLHEVLAEALAAAGDAFRGGVAPVDALLREAGLERRQHQVAPAGADWRAVDRLFRRRRLAAAHRLDEHEVDEAEMLIGASLVVLHGDDAPLGPPGEEADAAFLCALCLLRPGVARAFVGAHAERGTPPEDLAAFARFLLERVDPPADTGVRWLLARALDHLGDAPGAEAELEQAARSDIDHPLVLQMLAGFRSDRGDAPGALALLDRAAVALRPHEQRNQDDAGDAGDDGDDQDGERALADEALRAEVTGYARQRPTAVARRNDPCPCGSGRKYKACHLGKERHALVDRAPWLYDKACRYLRDGRHRTVALEVARAIHDAADGDHRLLLALLESPVTFDVSLHEGGVFADFLAERDALLPDDEALLAAQWALVARSVFEVEAKGHDSLALRDLRTGDRIEVTNITPSDHTRIGTYLLGRPLPVGHVARPVGLRARAARGPRLGARVARRARRGPVRRRRARGSVPGPAPVAERRRPGARVPPDHLAPPRSRQRRRRVARRPAAGPRRRAILHPRARQPEPARHRRADPARRGQRAVRVRELRRAGRRGKRARRLARSRRAPGRRRRRPRRGGARRPPCPRPRRGRRIRDARPERSGERRALRAARPRDGAALPRRAHPRARRAHAPRGV